MKLLVLAVVAIFVSASAAGWAAAQPPGGGPPGPGPLRPEVLERIVDDLNLPEKEKAKVDEILEAHEAKMRKAREEARATLLVNMKAVLTDKQFAQFKLEVERTPGPPPRDGGPRGGRGARGVSIDTLIDHVMSFDKNKDGKVTKEELPDRLHYLIEMGDTNKDGALTREELKAVATKINLPGGPRRQ
jgi:hypothetical protein